MIYDFAVSLRDGRRIVGTGGKIALGCGIALIAGARNKAHQLTSEQNRIEELQRRANANRFTPARDGAIPEDRLQKFLQARRRVYAVYEAHRDELDAMSKKKQADFGDVRKGFALINELRLAQAQALADVGMSEDEYRFIVQQIYKTAWEAGSARSAGARTAAEASVPPANLVLFRKYEADIKKYAMNGLDWIGL